MYFTIAFKFIVSQTMVEPHTNTNRDTPHTYSSSKRLSVCAGGERMKEGDVNETWTEQSVRYTYIYTSIYNMWCICTDKAQFREHLQREREVYATQSQTRTHSFTHSVIDSNLTFHTKLIAKKRNNRTKR